MIKYKLFIILFTLIISFSTCLSSDQIKSSLEGVEDEGEQQLDDEKKEFQYSTPEIDEFSKENVYIFSHFDDEQRFTEQWIKSEASKKDDQDNEERKYDGQWNIENTSNLKGIIFYFDKNNCFNECENFNIKLIMKMVFLSSNLLC